MAWKHPQTTPRLVRILQVRNSKDVYTNYEGYLARVDADTEVRRFHGTSSSPDCLFGINVNQPPCNRSDCAVCRICLQSFNVNLAGSGGGQRMKLRYGKGLYFSGTSSKSNDYAAATERTTSGRQVRLVFLCKVAVGKCYKTLKESLEELEVESEVHDKGYDSLLGETDVNGGALNYDELVVYRNEAAIPSYLIAYEVHEKV